MFGKKKQAFDNNSLNFKSKNYKMLDSYKSSDLIIANLEYVSSERTLNGRIVKTTEQKYIFEKMNDKGKTRYREIFTGFIADIENHYFDLPYVVNLKPLNEEILTVANSIPKYSLLLLMNEINSKYFKKELKK